MNKNKILSLVAFVALLTGFLGFMPVAQAAVSVTSATGGENLAVGSGFVNLTNILISESNNAEIGVGVHTFSLPAGWEFDTSGTINISTTSGVMVVSPVSITPGVTSFSFNVESPAVPGADMAIKNIRVRPTGTSGGYIIHSGAVIAGVDGTTNFGTLSVVGSGGGGSTPPTPSYNSNNSSAGGAPSFLIPPSNTRVTINNGDEKTNSRKVVLNLSAEYAGDVMVVNDVNDFNNAALQPYHRLFDWTLSEGEGEKAVYVKFRSPTGLYSEPVSDTIILDLAATDSNKTEEITVSQPVVDVYADVNKDGKVDVQDISRVILAYGNTAGEADINEDNLVDIKDFNEVIINWTGRNGTQGTVSNTQDAIFSISQNSFSLVTGQVVTVPVYLNSGSSPAYTVRLVVDYPSDILELTGSNLANGWISLAIGSENVSSIPESLIKTAGWPGGIQAGQFGTLTFKAKQAGTGEIAINSGSVVMDKRGYNKFTGFRVGVPVTVTGLITSDQTIENNGVIDSNTSTNNEDKGAISPETSEDRESLLASVIGLFTGWSGYVSLLILLAVLAGAYFSRRYWLIAVRKGEEQKEILEQVVRQDYENNNFSDSDDFSNHDNGSNNNF